MFATMPIGCRGGWLGKLAREAPGLRERSCLEKTPRLGFVSRGPVETSENGVRS